MTQHYSHINYNFNKFLTYLFIFSVVFILYSSAIIEYFPNFRFNVIILKAFCDFVIISLGIYLLTKKIDFEIKIIMFLFFLFSSFTFVVNSDKTNLLTHLNGIRDPLVFLSSMSFYNYILNADNGNNFVKKFSVFLLFFGISQIPLAIKQYLQFGAGDQVGGSFSSGGSGMITIIQFILLFYIFVYFSQNNHIIKLKLYNLIYFSLLIPTFINETKISIVLLPLCLFFLFFNKNRLINSILYSFVIFILVYLFIYIYDTAYKEADIGVASFLDFFNSDFFYYYLYGGSQGYWSNVDIPRLMKLVMLYDLISNNIFILIFGLGYGIFKGQNVLGTLDIQSKYWHLYFGSSSLINTAILQGGIILFSILIFAIFNFLLGNQKKVRSFNLIRFRVFMIIVTGIMILYNDALFINYFSVLFSYFLMFSQKGDNFLKNLA